MLLLFLLLSAGMAWLIITTSGFPYLGLAASAVIFSTVGYFFQKRKTVSFVANYACVIALSFFLIIRANLLYTFLNCAAIFYFLTLFVNSLDTIQNVKRLIVQPVITLIHLIKTQNKFSIKDSPILKEKHIKRSHIVEVVGGTGISIVILILIIPLLSFANPLFAKIMENLISWTNFPEIISNFIGKDFYIWAWRTVFFGAFLFILTKGVSYITSQKLEKKSEEKTQSPISLFIPKVVVITVLTVFFVTQLELYFASTQKLIEMGVTMSQQTREVFGHLLVVGLIIFALIYNHRGSDKKNMVANYALILTGIFLTLIAFKSDFDYSTSWGFTQKRLYGFAGVFWVISAFGILAYIYKNKLKNSTLITCLVYLSAIVLIGINIANFDYLIYNVNKSRTHSGEDQEYLATLSPDASSYRDQLSTLENALTKGNYHTTSAIWRLYSRILNLQNIYKNPDFRSFNYSEYLAYQQVKDVNLEKLSEKISNPVPQNRQVEPSPSQPQVTPQYVFTKITIKGLPLNLYDHYFQVRSVNDPSSSVLGGNLSLNTFYGTGLPGKFILSINMYNTKTTNQLQSQKKEIKYQIADPPPEKLEIKYK